MQAKQTGVGFTKRFHVISPLLIVAIFVLSLAFSLVGPATPTYAACPAGTVAGNGSAERPDATHCYDPTTNEDKGADPDANPGQTPGQDPTGQQTNQQAQDTTTNCAVEKIGWFVCPVMEQAAKLSDKAFDILADNFLRTEPQLVSDKSGTKVAWEIARNIANIMFIIAFLIIIVSQVTSMGISNYGIKRMIPRLLVAAVAVNASYYICQLVVDVTNILGYEIQNALVGIANSIGPSVFGNASQYGVVNTAHEGWGNFMEYIVLAALATAAIVWLVMGPMVAVIMMVLITVITIIVILLLRKALIVLLIVISPIAIVMYLLPNTEKFFSKWMSMFGKILMVFPVIGLLFGAGQLASTIVLVAGAYQSDEAAQAAEQCNPETKQSKDDYRDGKSGQKPGLYDYCGMKGVTVEGTKDGDLNCGVGLQIGGVTKGANGCRKTASLVLGLVAMGIAVAPLIAVWSVLKGALSAAGSMGGKLTAGITKGAGGLNKRAEAADQARQNRMALRSMQGRPTVGAGIYRRRAKRDAIRGSVERELKHAQSGYIADELTGENPDTALQKKMAGGAGLRSANTEALSRVEAAAINTARSEQNEALKAASQIAADQSSGELHAILDGEFDVNDPKVAAAINELGQRQDFGQLEKVMDKIAGKGPSLASRTLSSTLNENAGQLFTGGQIANLSRGENIGSYMDVVNKNLAEGVLSPEKMATLNPSLAGEVSHVLAKGASSTNAATQANAATAIGKLRTSATAVKGDDILNKKISRIENQLTNFAGGVHTTNR